MDLDIFIQAGVIHDGLFHGVTVEADRVVVEVEGRSVAMPLGVFRALITSLRTVTQ
jgi:hypothetical protein